MLKSLLKGWILPPNFLKLYHKLVALVRHRKSKTSPGIVKFKNIHHGKRCFILATGPSIKQMDLTWLKDEISIAVSFFGYHHEIEKISPTYQVCAPNHEPLGEKNVLNYLYMIRDSYKGKKPCFLGISEYEYSFDRVLKTYPELQPEEYYFIDYEGAPEISETSIKTKDVWDPLKTPMSLMTVAFEAIMLAVYMGCDKIYLLGCDYNYMKDLEGKREQHFYPDSQTVQGRERICEEGLEKFFETSYLLWKRYRLVFEHLASKGIMVYNASPDSSLDMFPKVSFDELK